MKIINILLCVLAFTLSIASVHAQNEQPVSEVYSLMVQYRADRGSLERFYFVQNSPERRERFRVFYKDYLNKLGKLPFESMSVNGRADYLLVKRDLETELDLLNAEEKEIKLVDKYVSPGSPIYELEKKRRRGLHLESSQIAKQLDEVNKSIREMQKKLKQEPNLTREVAARAEDAIKGQQRALKSVFEFYDGYDPQFSWWVTRPYQRLDTTLTKFAAALKVKVDEGSLPKDDGSGIIGNPIGREELLRLLQYEMIDYSPEELVEIANKEFAWCDAELLKASRAMGFGDDWKKAQEKVKQTYVPEGYQPEAMLKLYNESVDFLKKNDLITIPPIAEETWRMSMMSPKQQLVSPFF